MKKKRKKIPKAYHEKGNIEFPTIEADAQSRTFMKDKIGNQIADLRAMQHKWEWRTSWDRSYHTEEKWPIRLYTPPRGQRTHNQLSVIPA